MKCQKCGDEYPEREVQESHDVPCYLFIGMSRRVSKQQADKFTRRWLCKDCHEKYEKELNIALKKRAVEFAKKFFGEENGNY